MRYFTGDAPLVQTWGRPETSGLRTFFNAGIEEPFPGEDRLLIPSPRDVATYDHKPEMSAVQLTETLLARLADNEYDFVLVNYANPDMVGHTGDLAATVQS